MLDKCCNINKLSHISTVNQETYYSGHKRFHCVKYQSVLPPDGMIISLMGPFEGRRHDAGILRESNLHEQLQTCASFPDGQKFVIYGDQAYGIQALLLCPFPNRNLKPQQQAFNNSMKPLRQAVE
nr:unnamed protein product [Callosobruchus chinensis]